MKGKFPFIIVVSYLLLFSFTAKPIGTAQLSSVISSACCLVEENNESLETEESELSLQENEDFVQRIRFQVVNNMQLFSPLKFCINYHLSNKIYRQFIPSSIVSHSLSFTGVWRI